MTEAALGGDHPGRVRLDREAARLVAAAAARPDGGGDPSDDDAISYGRRSHGVGRLRRHAGGAGRRGRRRGNCVTTPPPPRRRGALPPERDARQAVEPARGPSRSREQLGKGTRTRHHGRPPRPLPERRRPAPGGREFLRLAAGGPARHLGDDHPAVGASLSNLAAGPEARRLRLLPGRLRRRVGRARLRRGAVPAGAGRLRPRRADAARDDVDRCGTSATASWRTASRAGGARAQARGPARERLNSRSWAASRTTRPCSTTPASTPRRRRRTGRALNWLRKPSVPRASTRYPPGRTRGAAVDAGKAGEAGPSTGLYWSGWRRSSAAGTPTPRRRATTRRGARRARRGTKAPTLRGRWRPRGVLRCRPPHAVASKRGSRRPRAARAGPGHRPRPRTAGPREPAVEVVPVSGSAGGAAALMSYIPFLTVFATSLARRKKNASVFVALGAASKRRSKHLGWKIIHLQPRQGPVGFPALVARLVPRIGATGAAQPRGSSN